MLITNPIGDMLTRIKNGLAAGHLQVVMPHSKLKVAIAKQLVENNYIEEYQIEEKHPQSDLVIKLRYVHKEPAITGVKQVSKPGRRLYAKVNKIPVTLGGYGMTLVSTSRGVLTDEQARQQNVGGELLCQIW